MIRITADAELRAKLLGLEEPLELCDESGHLLARVHPNHNPSETDRGIQDDFRRITVDSKLRARLGDFAKPAELCDESGHILATVWPRYDPSEHENSEPQLSEEELNHRRQYNGKSYTTEEVLAYLAQL